jgi:hypothetical protein
MKAHLVFGRDVLVGDVLKHLGHEDQLTLQLRTRLLYLQLIDESSVVWCVCVCVCVCVFLALRTYVGEVRAVEAEPERDR